MPNLHVAVSCCLSLAIQCNSTCSNLPSLISIVSQYVAYGLSIHHGLSMNVLSIPSKYLYCPPLTISQWQTNDKIGRFSGRNSNQQPSSTADLSPTKSVVYHTKSGWFFCHLIKSATFFIRLSLALQFLLLVQLPCFLIWQLLLPFSTSVISINEH